ncbi:MAG TPA: hypothetical protein VLX92_09985 [Kofleriaceae bacterium]|nr:hypothetical protein [Kofleriaceae bacterium]
MMDARVAWIAVVLAGCAPTYRYSFDLTEPLGSPQLQDNGPQVVSDADVQADLRIDADGDKVVIGVQNKTDQVLQVEWSNITLTRPDGSVTTLRPGDDVGWVKPGEKVAAELFPVVLPHKGDAAAAYDGRRLQLAVPMIVRRAARTYHFTFTAHTRKT